MDLGTVVPAVAGPARPQDRIELGNLKSQFGTIMGCEYKRDADIENISTYHNESGSETTRPESCEPSKKRCVITLNGEEQELWWRS